MKGSKYISSAITCVSVVSGLATCYQTIMSIIDSPSWKLLFSSTWFYITLIVFVVSIGFFMLFRKADQQRIQIEKLIAENQRQVNLNNIAKLHGHSLTFTHLKYQLSRLYNNHIELSQLSIFNTIENNDGPRKNSKVKMELTGICTEYSLCFKFAITGQASVTANQLKLSAFDHIDNTNLTVSTADYGIRNAVREYTITYLKPKNTHQPIHLTIQWEWPEMLELTDDYITLPNFFAESTKNIKISLKPLVTLATEVVNIYKYSPEMAAPEHLCDVRITPTGIFEFELDNPDNDTDYIMYYS